MRCWYLQIAVTVRKKKNNGDDDDNDEGGYRVG